MKISEFLRLLYGTVMGTSTQYLKPRQRHLFPLKELRLEEEAITFVGGSCNSVFFRRANLLVNPGEGRAAQKVFDLLTHRYNVRVESIICTQSSAQYAEGSRLYSDCSVVYSPQTLKKEPRFKLVTDSLRLPIKGSDTEFLQVEVFDNCYSERDLIVVGLEGRLILTGGIFYNRIHPPLPKKMDLKNWIRALENLQQRPGQFLPGEGEIATAASLEEFKNYLTDLSNQSVEFSECRKNYDWSEIIGHTSLEENFERLRNNEFTHAEFRSSL